MVSGQLIPVTPKIKKVSGVYDQIRFEFDGTLYDGFSLEVGKSKTTMKLAANSVNKYASIFLNKGTYYARARAYTKVNGKNVYSGYSDIVKFSVDKNGNVKVKVNVGKAKIKKIKRNGTKIKVTIKKVKGATKYQIKYSTSKKFTKKATKTVTTKKTTKTIKKLKKNKKYYVKVRAYKKVNGKKYYGKWSKVKTVKKSK